MFLQLIRQEGPRRELRHIFTLLLTAKHNIEKRIQVVKTEVRNY